MDTLFAAAERSLPVEPFPPSGLPSADGTHVVRGQRSALERRIRIELHQDILTRTRRRPTRAWPATPAQTTKGISCPGRRVVPQRRTRTLYARVVDTAPLYPSPRAHRGRCGYLARMAGVRGFEGCVRRGGSAPPAAPRLRPRRAGVDRVERPEAPSDERSAIPLPVTTSFWSGAVCAPKHREGRERSDASEHTGARVIQEPDHSRGRGRGRGASESSPCHQRPGSQVRWASAPPRQSAGP